ncbi:hypothetical protein GSI_13910 [Ganoderma sinense ZZ0214-1]|uniref:Uncharacterized protein n=1 Tax=Ganoderma sinense ZZ0214-1 TaxID=1077348 RepID=A0A2G8RRM2_9APHY|nr:hypothetical protein GSI_13910 [Ganoderma sinense ZZ0214-1]
MLPESGEEEDEEMSDTGDHRTLRQPVGVIHSLLHRIRRGTVIRRGTCPALRQRGALPAPVQDSGVIVLERGSTIVDMLTSGGGRNEETNITYITYLAPYWWLHEQIKKVFPGCYLYDVVQ